MNESSKINILSLTSDEAKKFFLNEKSYCTLDLPKYISFQKLLDSLSNKLNNSTYQSIKKKNPDQYENINYVLFHSKDGGYDWRPFELINPVMYISLVNVLTKEENWQLIINRFNEIDLKSVIKCESIPDVDKIEDLNKQKNQILNWWDKTEQNSIKLSLEYDYLFQTDIVNCYSEIYTHSIAWAIHQKEVIKKNKKSKDYFGNIIDKHLQNMSYGQTNGIPQGSILMDFVAEILLKYADELITNHIIKKHISKDDFYILRYRDDYRIFVNEVSLGREIMKIIAEELTSLGLKLNINKTGYSDNVILSSIKKDKLEFFKNTKNNNLQKRLIQLYEFSLKFPNSGSVSKEMTKIREKIEKMKNFSKENIEVLISLVTEIIYKNPRIYIEGNAILSSLFLQIENEIQRKNIIKKVFKKLKKILNSGYFEIWFQRATIKENELDIEYEENICKLVEGNSINLWNIDWISDKGVKKIFEDVKIINEEEKEKMPKKIDKSEIQIFDGY